MVVSTTADGIVMPSYKIRKSIAKKVTEKKGGKGYTLSEEDCPDCEMPLMELKGRTECKVCPAIKKWVERKNGSSSKANNSVEETRDAEVMESAKEAEVREEAPREAVDPTSSVNSLVAEAKVLAAEVKAQCNISKSYSEEGVHMMKANDTASVLGASGDSEEDNEYTQFLGKSGVGGSEDSEDSEDTEAIRLRARQIIMNARISASKDSDEESLADANEGADEEYVAVSVAASVEQDKPTQEPIKSPTLSWETTDEEQIQNRADEIINQARLNLASENGLTIPEPKAFPPKAIETPRIHVARDKSIEEEVSVGMGSFEAAIVIQSVVRMFLVRHVASRPVDGEAPEEETEDHEEEQMPAKVAEVAEDTAKSGGGETDAPATENVVDNDASVKQSQEEGTAVVPSRGIFANLACKFDDAVTDAIGKVHSIVNCNFVDESALTAFQSGADFPAKSWMEQSHNDLVATQNISGKVKYNAPPPVSTSGPSNYDAQLLLLSMRGWEISHDYCKTCDKFLMILPGTGQMMCAACDDVHEEPEEAQAARPEEHRENVAEPSEHVIDGILHEAKAHASLPKPSAALPPRPRTANQAHPTPIFPPPRHPARNNTSAVLYEMQMELVRSASGVQTQNSAPTPSQIQLIDDARQLIMKMQQEQARIDPNNQEVPPVDKSEVGTETTPDVQPAPEDVPTPKDMKASEDYPKENKEVADVTKQLHEARLRIEEAKNFIKSRNTAPMQGMPPQMHSFGSHMAAPVDPEVDDDAQAMRQMGSLVSPSGVRSPQHDGYDTPVMPDKYFFA